MLAVVTFRLGTADDGAGMLAVHRGSIQAIDTIFYNETAKASWAFDLRAERYVKSMAEGEIFRLAIDEDQRIVGFCGIKAGEILGLYVHSEMQGQGIGRALLIDAESGLEDEGHQSSELVASLNAQAFYAAHGWEFGEYRTKMSRGGLEQPVALMRKFFVVSSRSAVEERALPA